MCLIFMNCKQLHQCLGFLRYPKMTGDYFLFERTVCWSCTRELRRSRHPSVIQPRLLSGCHFFSFDLAARPCCCYCSSTSVSAAQVEYDRLHFVGGRATHTHTHTSRRLITVYSLLVFCTRQTYKALYNVGALWWIGPTGSSWWAICLKECIYAYFWCERTWKRKSSTVSPFPDLWPLLYKCERRGVKSGVCFLKIRCWGGGCACSRWWWSSNHYCTREEVRSKQLGRVWGNWSQNNLMTDHYCLLLCKNQ